MFGENYKIIVDKLQCVWVPLFSSLKLGTSVYFVRSYEKKCWPLLLISRGLGLKLLKNYFNSNVCMYNMIVICLKKI
jgi:hypothetical protein